MDADRIASLAKKIHAAKKIIILGGDLATNLVGFLHYHLILLGLPSVTATSSGEAAHLTRSAAKATWLLRSASPRLAAYGGRSAASAANGAYCVGIADYADSPIARFAMNASSLRWKRLPLGLRILHPCACSMRFLTACGHYDSRRQLETCSKKAAEEQRTGFRWYRE